MRTPRFVDLEVAARRGAAHASAGDKGGDADDTNADDLATVDELERAVELAVSAAAPTAAAATVHGDSRGEHTGALARVVAEPYRGGARRVARSGSGDARGGARTQGAAGCVAILTY